MKTTFPVIRYLLLAWLIISMVGIMAIPFLSYESRMGLVETFRSMQRFFFWGFLALLGGYALWNAKPRSEAHRSRDVCRDAYEALYRYFETHALEGADTEACQPLQNTLEAELSRHCWFFQKEFAHTDIRKYRRYLQRIRDTKSVY